jgi:hypothetical protein
MLGWGGGLITPTQPNEFLGDSYMSNKLPTNHNRRSFLKLAGGGLAAAGSFGLLPTQLRRQLSPVSEALAAPNSPANLFFIGTDGWISLPKTAPALSSSFYPDVLAPSPDLTTYIFGFRNMTGIAPTDARVIGQKMKAQHNAPLFWVDEYDPTTDNVFRLDLLNIGLQMRPDLTDSHTMHWHGFRNVIPFFDGEPTGSFAVPVGSVFRYVYKPRECGTYMFHCHVEDTEHVHMGMTGLVFVRPKQNKGTPISYQGRIYNKFAYNDGDGSTGYDREFGMFLSEVWNEAHWDDAHIQLPEWSDYKVDFALLNGRAYPDTLAPNSPFNTGTLAAQSSYDTQRDSTGDLIPPVGRPDLKYQPLSALVTCNAGERVLLRFANLGFKEASMTLAGIKMKVVGKDATPMRGFNASGTARTGVDTSYETNTLLIGAGESIDAIFTAPAHSGGSGYDTYILYNRAYDRSDNQAGGSGGQRTEIRVYAAGRVPAQTIPNQLPAIP